MNSNFENSAPAKIFPSKILAEECFDLVITPGQTQATQCITYQGNVYAEIPYDGYKFFTYKAIQKLKNSEAIRAQAGWLALSNPIDWELSWERNHGTQELVDVLVPIRSDSIRQEDWDTSAKIIRLAHQYMQGQQFPLPIVVLDVEIFDGIPALGESVKLNDFKNKKEDEIIRTILSKAKPGLTIQKNQNIDSKDVESELVESGEMLVVKLEIKVQVPLVLEVNSGTNISVDYIELNWPTIVTQQGLMIVRKISDTDKFRRQDWHYCPDNSSIQTSLLRLTYVKPKARRPQSFNEYGLTLYLLVCASEGLINQDKLQGHMKLRIENVLFSGRDIAWIHSTGKRQKIDELPMVKKHTFCNVNFDITLSELFDKRQILITHQWCFPGVYLNANRLDDLQGILKDIGYETDPPEYETDETGANGSNEKAVSGFKLVKVSGKRYHVKSGEKIRTMNIVLWAVKTATTITTRKREIERQGIYKSSIPTSDLVILLLGEIDGAAELLSRDVQKIVTKLKKRLNAVADAR